MAINYCLFRVYIRKIILYLAGRAKVYCSTLMYFEIFKLLLDSLSDWIQIEHSVTDRASECYLYS